MAAGDRAGEEGAAVRPDLAELRQRRRFPTPTSASADPAETRDVIAKTLRAASNGAPAERPRHVDTW